MVQIRITNISGGTYPINVWISDVYGNNEVLVDTISSSVPPVDYIYLPPIFDNAPAIMIKIVDALNCEKFKVYDCRFGCGFEIQIVELS